MLAPAYDRICNQLAMTATIAAIPAALTATLMAFMIDFSHNRSVRSDKSRKTGQATRDNYPRRCRPRSVMRRTVALRIDGHRCLEDY